MTSPYGPVAFPLMGCLVLLISAIFLVLSFASPFWAFDGLRHRGLWRLGECGSGHVDCWRADQMHYYPVWLYVVQAFECVAIIFISLPLVVIPIYMYVAVGLKYKLMMGLTAICSGIATICIFIGVITYGTQATQEKRSGSDQEGWDLMWCFIVNIVAGAVALIGLIVFIIAFIKKKPPFKEYYSTPIVEGPAPQVYAIGAQSVFNAAG